jgi:hypothetical protein
MASEERGKEEKEKAINLILSLAIPFLTQTNFIITNEI